MAYAPNTLQHTKRLKVPRHLRRDEVSRTIQFIFEESARAKNVDIGRAAFSAGVNLLGNMIFSQSVFDPQSRGSQQFREAVGKVAEIAGAPNLADFFLFLRILDLQSLSRHFSEHPTHTYGIVQKFIEDRLAASHFNNDRSDAEKDFVDVLLDCRSHEFTLADIRVFLSEMFIAGGETTSTAIEWAMAELMRHPNPTQRIWI